MFEQMSGCCSIYNIPARAQAGVYLENNCSAAHLLLSFNKFLAVQSPSILYASYAYPITN